MPIWGEVELLCRAISEEGRREADRILSEAKSEAEKIIAEAQNQAENRYEEEILSRRSKAHSEARRMIDSAELGVRRRLMAFREEIVREIFETLQERLKHFRDEPSYADFLMLALREAIGHLPGKEFIAELDREDERLIKDRIEGLVRELSVTIETRQLPALDGGVRVFTGDQRLLYDNSLSARLRRNEDAIRQEIWGEIFGTESR